MTILPSLFVMSSNSRGESDPIPIIGVRTSYMTAKPQVIDNHVDLLSLVILFKRDFKRIKNLLIKKLTICLIKQWINNGK